MEGKIQQTNRVAYYADLDFSKSSARAFHVIEIIKRLDSEVLILHRESDTYIEEFQKLREKENISTFSYRSKTTGFIPIIRELKEYGPDAVYCRNTLLDPIPSLVSKIDFKTILEVNGDLAYEMKYQGRKLSKLGFLIDYIQRKNMREAEKIVFISQKLRERYPGFKDSKVEVIENGVDKALIEKYSDTNKYEVFTVCYLGSFSRMKGIGKIPEIAEQLPDIQFKLVGGSELEGAEGLGNLEIIGRKPHHEALEILAKSHVSILPYPEDFDTYFSPFKLFESMAVGTVPITTPNSEPARIIKETECGVVTDSFDNESLIEGLRNLSGSQPEEFRQRGITSVQEKYNWERATKKIISLIESVNRKRKPKGGLN